MALGRAASRRIFAASLVQNAGTALAVAVPLAVGALVAHRLFPALRLLPPGVVAGIPIAVGAVGALIVSRLRMPGIGGALRAADQRLGLKDRLSSAYEFSDSKEAFAPLAVEDAESRSDVGLLHRAFPVRFGRPWYIAGSAAAAAIAVVLWLPPREMKQALVAAKPTPTPTQIADASTQIRAASQALEQLSTPGTLATASELSNLAEIERDLAAGNLTPDEARAKSAEAINQAAAAAEEAAATTDEATDESVKQLAAGARRAGESASEAGEIARSLARGDAQSAAEAARRAVEAAGKLPDAEREAMANELIRLAKELDEAKKRAEERSTAGAPQESASETQDGGDAGPSGLSTPESAPAGEKSGTEGIKDTTLPRTERAEEKKGKVSPPPTTGPTKVSEGSKSSEAKGGEEDLTEEDGKRDLSNGQPSPSEDGEKKGEEGARKQAEKKIDKLAEALREAAKELKESGKDDSASPQTPKDAPAGEAKPAEEGTGRQPGDPNGKKAPGAAKSEERNPSDVPRESVRDPSAEKGASPEASGSKDPSGKDAGRNARQGEARESSKREDVPQSGTGQSQSKPDGETPGTAPGEGPRDTPGTGDGKRPVGEKREGATDQAPPKEKQPEGTDGSPAPSKDPGSGLERLAKELKDLADQRSRAAGDREKARDLRREAQRLLDQGIEPEMAKDLPEDAPGERPEGPKPDSKGEQPGRSGEPRSDRRSDVPDATPGTRNDRRGAQRARGEPDGSGGAGDVARKNPPVFRPDWTGPTDLVDARPEGTADGASRDPNMTVAPGPESRQPIRSSSPAVLDDRIRRAASGAERAVEQQAVPAQYSQFVKRVFRRYVDRVGAGAPTNPAGVPATPDAPDAPARR